MVETARFQKRKPIIMASQKADARMAEGQCDACPPGMLIKSDYKTELNNFNYYFSPYLNIFSLDNDFKVAHGTHLASNPLVMNESALNLIQYFDQPEPLNSIFLNRQEVWDYEILDNALKKMTGFNLIVPTEHSEPEYIESTDTLTALLHLTTFCNMACDYCYLADNRFKMSLSTGYAIIDNVFRSAALNKFPAIKLKYSGGEPLSCLSSILTLHKYATSLADKYNTELKGVILSNGTLLTPEITDKIRSSNLRLMISLDGIKEYHNCHRRFPNGSGSFEKVSDSIDLALSKGLIPDISITVSSRNAEGLPQLMEWILKRDLPFSLNFYRESDFSKNHKDLQLEEEKIVTGMLAAYKVIESNLPRQSLLASLADRANLAMPHLRPCSVGHSYMVFDCHGNISKCQMQINKPVTDIHADDPLTLIRQDQAGIRNIKVDEKEECKSCQWKYWCAGGCPLSAFRVSGRYDVKSPNCNIYKKLYPEIIRLEGLRIINSYEKDLNYL
ncbi:MAG: radical SAM protein [Desulfobacterales bacterium]|nr:radical SAM protein [Desulfobacterales bacterium]